MDNLPASAAVLAAAVWAVAGLIAYAPVRALGTYRFAKIQIFSSTILVGLLAGFTGGFSTLNFADWLPYLVSGLIGVMATNLAFASSIRRGGPRRAEVLSTTNVIFSGILGYVLLGELLTMTGLVGCVLVITGILLAVVYDRPNQDAHPFEQIEGSLLAVVALGVLAGLFQALGLLALKNPMAEGLDPLAAAAMRLGVCSLVIIAYERLRGQPLLVLKAEERRIALLAVVPGFLGYVVASALLLYAVGQRNVAEMLVLGSLSPVLILPLQWMVTKERPGLGALFGAILAVSGVYLLV